MKDFDLEKRIDLAIQNFESGYNCSQSVFLAYSDVLELDLDMAKRMSVSFGGGMGRMREVCGTMSAMAMLAGFKYPVIDPNDLVARKRNYAMVQKMGNLFKEQYGTIICRQLLSPEEAEKTTSAPTPRTKEYYTKRPCGKYVAEAARIAGLMLKGDLLPE